MTAEKTAGPPVSGDAGLPPLQGVQLAVLTFSVAFATFMELLDLTVVNVAIPHIAGNLGVSTNQGTWVISSYSVSSAIALPLTGWIAKRFGEVRAFIVALLLFNLVSMFCGLAINFPMLVTFRVIQGFVSGPMVPLAITLLLSNYPPAKRGIALTVWSMTVVLAPLLGPMLGGYITDHLSWRWIFYINAPTGMLAAYGTYVLLRGRETKTKKEPIDVLGLLLLVVGVGCFQIMLDTGQDLDWFGSRIIITLAVVAAVALTFFVAWELTDAHPIVDLTLLAKRNYSVGILILVLGLCGMFGINIIFPLWLQTVMGYTAAWAGLATAPVGILSIVVSPFVGRNLQRVDLRLLVTLAVVVFGTTAFWLSGLTLDASLKQLILPRFFQGLGISCFFVPINQIILSGLPPERFAAASGLMNFFRSAGMSFATAISVTFWSNRAIYHHARLLEHLTPNDPATVDYLQRLGAVLPSQEAVYRQMEKIVNAQSYMMATDDIFWAVGVMFFLLIGVIWLTRPPFGTMGQLDH